MDGSSPSKYTVPGNIAQIFIVTKYELIKHFRSKRLIGTIVIIALILGLIYSLPPLLGSPYSGTSHDELTVIPSPEGPGNISYAFFSTETMVEGTLIITINDTVLPDAGWDLIEVFDQSAIVFYGNLTGEAAVGNYDFKTSTIDFSFGFLTFAEILIIICAMFFAADVLVSEFQNRTAYLLFPNPVRREILLTGKFLASFIASFAMVLIYYAVIIILSLVTLGAVAEYIHLSFAFAILFLLASLALAYFISSVMKGSTGSIVLTFFLLLMIMPIIEGVGGAAGVKMWFLLTFAAHSLIYSLSYADYPVDTSQEFAGGFTYYAYFPELGLSAIVLSLYVVAFVLISVILFKRKELNT